MPTPRNPLAVSLLILIGFGLAPAPTTRAADDNPWPLGPDSQPQDGVPKGKVTQHRWTTSKVFPGTQRDYWVYVPAQYDGNTPAAVMVFQDGGGFVDPNGPYRTPIVLDNLIHKKQIPVTIGVFINPGVIPATKPNAHPRYNRSFEYDSPTDQYARFLLEEMLPEVGKTYKLTDQATGRAICGTSSGGICAFAAAWERPGAFSRVVSFIGSFTNLRGGNVFPTLVRKCEPKPIRVFLQDGKNDLDIYSGSWWIGNLDLAAALKFAGYEHQFVVGEGGHDTRHPGQVLPDALRFIWKDYPKLPAKGTFEAGVRDGRPTVVDVLLPDQGWQLLGEGYKFSEGPAADTQGNVYFTDIPADRIHKIDEAGKVSVFAEDTGGANGLMFGPDGRLYACQGGAKRVVAYDTSTGKAETIAEDIECNDLVVAHDGGIYVTEPPKHQVWYISPKREKKVVDTGLGFPNGLILTPDQSQLVVADTRSLNLFAFQIQADGSLTNKQPYFTCHAPYNATDSGADGLTIDTEGRLYATTHMGLQFFDQAGRVNGIIAKPQNAWLANVCFGGKDLNWLYVTCGDKVYRRKTKAKGVLSFQDPLLPPQPKL